MSDDDYNPKARSTKRKGRKQTVNRERVQSRIRTAAVRQRETEAEHQLRITEDRNRTNLMRQEETEAEYQLRITQDRNRTNLMRQEETEAEHQLRITEVASRATGLNYLIKTLKLNKLACK
jgi:hypothetical protein